MTVALFWSACLLFVLSVSMAAGGGAAGSDNSTVVLLSEIAATLQLNHSGITVSGLSSGGYMAVQMHVAFRYCACVVCSRESLHAVHRSCCGKY